MADRPMIPGNNNLNSSNSQPRLMIPKKPIKGDKLDSKKESRAEWKEIYSSPKMTRYKKGEVEVEVYPENINGKRKWFVSINTDKSISDKEFKNKFDANTFANDYMADYLQDKPLKTIFYKNEEIQVNPNGVYSSFVEGEGWVKADTMRGIKRLIDDSKGRKIKNGR